MSPNVRLIALGLALATALPALAGAQNLLPHRRAGMWETSMNLAGRSFTTGLCTDETVESRFSSFNPQQMGARECTGMTPAPIPGGFRMEGTCNVGGRSSHMVAKITGDFNNAYVMDMTSDAGGRPTTIHMDARWTGPCPAGRKPGDMVMPGGMVMNIANLPGMK